MTSQAYNNSWLLFPLQIWKQPRGIKCSDQFRVNKRDTDCFELLHEENTKLQVNISVRMLEFSCRLQFFFRVFTEESGGMTELLELDSDVLLLLNADLRKQQSRDGIKNNKDEEWN